MQSRVVQGLRQEEAKHPVINVVQESIGTVERLHHFVDAPYALVQHQVLPIVLQRR
jgi:hypothetical protein